MRIFDKKRLWSRAKVKREIFDKKAVVKSPSQAENKRAEVKRGQKRLEVSKVPKSREARSVKSAEVKWSQGESNQAAAIKQRRSSGAKAACLIAIELCFLRVFNAAKQQGAGMSELAAARVLGAMGAFICLFCVVPGLGTLAFILGLALKFMAVSRISEGLDLPRLRLDFLLGMVFAVTAQLVAGAGALTAVLGYFAGSYSYGLGAYGAGAGALLLALILLFASLALAKNLAAYKELAKRSGVGLFRLYAPLLFASQVFALVLPLSLLLVLVAALLELCAWVAVKRII